MPETPDDDFILVSRLVAQEVRGAGNPFPPPTPYGRWSDDAVYEQTVALYEKKGFALVAEARVAAKGDQGHLERRLLKTIHNYLIDEAKATPVGLMRNRVGTMLKNNSDFERIAGPGIAVDGWAVAGSLGAAGLLWQADRAELDAAAAAVPVPPDIKFHHQGPPPRSTKNAMTEVIKAVFAAADGFYLADQVLAQVIHERFDEFLHPEERDATEFRSSMEVVDDLDGGTELGYLDVEAEDLAEHIWIEMSYDERKAYPMLGVDGDEQVRRDAVMFAVGCGPHEADAIISSVFDRIRAEDLGEDPRLVVEALSRRAMGTSGLIRGSVDEGGS